jgi:hypothetical protein
MASISKRLTAAGEARSDVRYRAGGRAMEEAFSGARTPTTGSGRSRPRCSRGRSLIPVAGGRG